MAEILINGPEIEMPITPKNPLCIAIYPDGTVDKDYGEGFLLGTEAKAQEILPHAKLGDVEQFVEDIINSSTLKAEFTPYQLTLLRRLAKASKAIIPASKE